MLSICYMCKSYGNKMYGVKERDTTYDAMILSYQSMYYIYAVVYLFLDKNFLNLCMLDGIHSVL